MIRRPPISTRTDTLFPCTPLFRSACAASPLSLGNIEAMTRGELQWKISIPADGRLAMQGIAPALIQWETDTNPAGGMPDAGPEERGGGQEGVRTCRSRGSADNIKKKNQHNRKLIRT